MHLVYFDESGNSGNNLNDRQQPIFVLGALIVHEECWQQLENDLEESLRAHFPDFAEAGLEIHVEHLRNGRRGFRKHPMQKRISLRDSWIRIAQSHQLKLVYRSIDKKRYSQWMHATFGGGIAINPHVVAFPLVSMVVNDYLANISALGMFISDENKEIVRDVEKSIRQLRLIAGPLRLSQIIEKGFFIDSAKSRVLQLCDMCVMTARKNAEAEKDTTLKGFDAGGQELIEPLLLRGNEKFQDVIAWLKDEESKRGK